MNKKARRELLRRIIFDCAGNVQEHMPETAEAWLELADELERAMKIAAEECELTSEKEHAND